MVGLVDVDGHNFPNFALLRIAGYLRDRGDPYEWASSGIFREHYDEIYASKVFTFTQDVDWSQYDYDVLHKGGTGYDIKSRLPEEIERSLSMDYRIYSQYEYSVQFFSRGCIRHCPFCLVREKEGHICPVEPVELNPRGRWIEVLDNNFFANPEWRGAIDYLHKADQPVKLHGVDLRIMDEEQAYALKTLKTLGEPHIAWDMPKADLRPQLEAMASQMNPHGITCYVLVGFNSTIEEDLFRVRAIKERGFVPFVQPYRDFENKRRVKWYEKDLARWANNRFFVKACDFEDFEPRKGFKCREYLYNPDLLGLDWDPKRPPIATMKNAI